MKRSGICSSNFPRPAAVENYRRELNLDTAVASVSYTANGVRFKREIFCSPVDQVIVVRLTADQPGQISFTARMATPQRAATATEMFGTPNSIGKIRMDMSLPLNLSCAASTARRTASKVR